MKITEERVLALMKELKKMGLIKYYNDFYDTINLNRQNVVKVQAGDMRFTLTQIEAICQTYNVNPSWIFGYDDSMFRKVK